MSQLADGYSPARVASSSPEGVAAAKAALAGARDGTSEGGGTLRLLLVSLLLRLMAMAGAASPVFGSQIRGLGGRIRALDGWIWLETEESPVAAGGVATATRLGAVFFSACPLLRQRPGWCPEGLACPRRR
jgi:hypothetical protein